MTLSNGSMEYRSRLKSWRTARCLYYGGELLKKHSEEFLTRRQKEPAEVYAERIAASYYENYIGSIIDWYLAALFRREPVIVVDKSDFATQSLTSRFIENCDRKKTNIAEFFRTVLRDAMLFGNVFVVMDFPALDGVADTRADEVALGGDIPYLILCTPEQVIDWSFDEFGRLETVSIRGKVTEEETDGLNQIRSKIFRYTRKWLSVVEVVERAGGDSVETEVERKPHCMSHLEELPVLRLEVPHGLWLMERAGNVQLEHYNKSNALAWALSMGLYATPVVYSDREWNQITGDSYYIQLSPQDRFGWTEPEGKVYQIASQNLERLKTEIFRVCHVPFQAGWSGNPALQSGLSKQRDFQVTQEVLRAYGDWVKAAIKTLLEMIFDAREEDAAVTVSGMDQFDIGEFSAELADAERLLSLNIGSETLRRQIYKKLALQFICDVRQDIKDQIVAEIDGM